MFLPKKIVSFPSLSDALGYVRQETNRLVENPSLDYKDYLLGERKFFFYVGDKDDTEQWEFAIIEMEGGRPVIV